VLRILSAVLVAVLLVAGCGSDDNDNGEATAEFTGDGCVYSGPTEFELGDDFEVTVSDVTEERMDVGFGVVKVPDGMTVDEFKEQGAEGLIDDASGTFLWSEVTEEDTDRVLSFTLNETGTWLVNCFNLGTSNPDDVDNPATTFEVVEKS
jgi:hypothetical protein